MDTDHAGKVFLILALSCAVLCMAFPSRSFSQENPALGAVEELPPSKLDALLTEIEDELGDIHSLKVEFLQEKHLSIFMEPVQAKGILLFRRPSHIRFEITDPFHSVLTVRGRSMSKHERVDGKWLKLKPASLDSVLVVTGQIASWLRGRLREEEDVYDISATAEDDPTVFLRPKDARLRKQITRIELRFRKGPWRVATLVIYEPNGDFTFITFHDEEHGIQFPDRFFDTSDPVPAEVDFNK